MEQALTLIGRTGSGKTTLLQQLKETENYKVIHIYAREDKFKELNEKIEANERGVIIFDDYNDRIGSSQLNKVEKFIGRLPKFWLALRVCKNSSCR